jgi:hypothetical protein
MCETSQPDGDALPPTASKNSAARRTIDTSDEASRKTL